MTIKQLYGILIPVTCRIMKIAFDIVRAEVVERYKDMPISVYVLRENHHAYVWYLKHGFCKVEESDKYYLLRMKI